MFESQIASQFIPVTVFVISQAGLSYHANCFHFCIHVRPRRRCMILNFLSTYMVGSLRSSLHTKSTGTTLPGQARQDGVQTFPRNWSKKECQFASTAWPLVAWHLLNTRSYRHSIQGCPALFVSGVNAFLKPVTNYPFGMLTWNAFLAWNEMTIKREAYLIRPPNGMITWICLKPSIRIHNKLREPQTVELVG